MSNSNLRPSWARSYCASLRYFSMWWSNGYATFRSGRFGLVDSVWPFRSEPFRSGDISVWPFRSGDMSVQAVSVWGHFCQTMKICGNLTR